MPLGSPPNRPLHTMQCVLVILNMYLVRRVCLPNLSDLAISGHRLA